MKVIIVSGTPAAGKKTITKWLSKELSFKVLNLKPLIKKLSEKFDSLKQCYVVDLKKLNQEVVKLIQEEKKKFKEIKKSEMSKKKTQSKNKKTDPQGLIIPSHLIHHLPKIYVDLCLVIKCSDLKKLEQRLIKRKYSKKKIMENLQCKIFDICLEEAKKKKHQILIVDTHKKTNQKNIIHGIKKLI